MLFGLTTPIVTLASRTHAVWERSAGPEELREIARCATGVSERPCSIFVSHKELEHLLDALQRFAEEIMTIR
jgi:hypothetical protein